MYTTSYMSIEHGTISIGPEHFQSDLRIYSDWMMAWWRENFQNSVDANADEIRVSTESTADGNKVKVTFIDNGVGMTREQLKSVYFVLGETTKKAGQTIGGYGRARIMTCFAQGWYELRTGNLLVKGRGASYSIEEVSEFHQGVALTVEVNATQDNMLQKLTYYLQRSHVRNARVFINGKRWTEWTYIRNHRKELTFGHVYTNQSKASELLVRIDGTLMFATYTRAPYQVIVELHHNQFFDPRKYLAANRDHLVSPYTDELASFIAELNINKQSALKPRFQNKSAVVKGRGTFVSRRKKAEPEVKFKVDSHGHWAAMGEAARTTSHSDGTAELWERLRSLKDISSLFDVIIEDNSENPDVRRVIDSYNPQNWDLRGERSIAHGKPYRSGLDKFKLLTMWKTACAAVIDILMEHLGLDQVSWGVGWYFGDPDGPMNHTTGARHQVRNDVHFLLLNPVNIKGTMRYSLSKKTSWATLISDAIHEVTHIAKTDHDEDFANLQSDLTERVMGKFNETMRMLGEAKADIEAEYALE